MLSRRTTGSNATTPKAQPILEQRPWLPSLTNLKTQILSWYLCFEVDLYPRVGRHRAVEIDEGGTQIVRRVRKTRRNRCSVLRCPPEILCQPTVILKLAPHI
jgi:hypothetical protein